MRVRRLWVAPNRGYAFYDIPKEDEHRLSKLLGFGWRPATKLERVRYELTAPRFSWITLIAIVWLTPRVVDWLMSILGL